MTRFVATVASGLSVVVADSGYAKVAFLAAFVGLTHVCGLVRLAYNRVLNGARRPPPGSPAVKHGDVAGCPATDQRGFLRVGGCDIGAFEYAFRALLPLMSR